MAISGTVKCGNCSSNLALKWVKVKHAHRTHHAGLDCPLCGSPEPLQTWLKSGEDKGQTYILLSVETDG